METDRGTLLRAIGIIVASVILALWAVSCLAGMFSANRDSSQTPTASFPSIIQARAVVSVSDALAIQAGDDHSELAVAGWFQQPFPFECPAPLVQPVPLLEGPCKLQGWLMADPESAVLVHENGMETRPIVGANVDVAFDGPDTNWERPLPKLGGSIPLPVVFIGHFDDIRAAGCQPENRQSCLDRFVVTIVAWLDGVDRP